MWSNIIVAVLLICILLPDENSCLNSPVSDNTRILRYDVNKLLSLRPRAKNIKVTNIPPEIRRKTRRGRRGGTRMKMKRRGNRPFLPVITFGNCRSIYPKIDELRANCQHLYQYREACCLGFTETWLDDRIPDTAIDVANFNVIRADRDPNNAKSRGGGLAFYINNAWCNDIKVKKQECDSDLELLCVSVRPYYLPREFSNIFPTARKFGHILPNCM